MARFPEELTYAFFESRLRIDRNQLDKEIEEQAELYGRAQEQSVLARSKAVKAKDELATAEARSYKMLAKKASEKPGQRTTVDALRNAVQSHPVRVEAFDAWLHANEEAARLEGLVEAFRQRGYMLRELAQLLISGFLETKAVRGPAARGAEDVQHEERRKSMAQKRDTSWRSKL